jgi:hypothetical protein
MPEEHRHADGIGRIPGRAGPPAESLARMLLLSCLTTALPIPFVREWGVLAIFLWIAVGNRRFALPHDVLGQALVALAAWAVAGGVWMALNVEPWWILYEEVPCALQVLVVMCLVPRVTPGDLDRALGRLGRGFLIGGVCLSVLALLLYFAHRALGPAMDRVFALAGSNRVAEARASLRADYNACAVGVTALAAAGAIMAVPMHRVRAAVVLLSAFAVDLVSDSRRVLLLVSFVIPTVIVAWFGLRRAVLVIGGLALVGALTSTLLIHVELSDVLAPRTLAWLDTQSGSMDELWDAIMRDGMWEWGMAKVGVAPPVEWTTGFGLQHMLEIGGIFTDPLEPNQTYGYVHNVFLGTMLTFGALGLTCLLAVMLGVARRIMHLRARPSGQVLMMLLLSALVMGFWSGNTPFSIPLLAVCLAVATKVRRDDGSLVNEARA